MKRLSVIFLLILFIIHTTAVSAVVNPLENSNNKYGISIIDENDLTDAISLVNSNGGEWGYITMVIAENDRSVAKWQRTFDRMRREKVIPVIRIATAPQGDVWKKPTEEDAVAWADFLGSLNWVVKNRYVVLFNEPNHAKEWGGSISASEYARTARAFRDKLKEKSPDFFVLPGGLDQAAGTMGDTLSAADYFEHIYAADPTFFTIFDGWTIHAYPNPNFSGSPSDNGRGSIRGHVWEINLLGKYGLRQDIPIFITETGWAHQEGQGSYRPSDIVASFYKDAYTNAWNDPRIVMVSPFIFNYPTAPFAQFSWKRPEALANESETPKYFPQYYSVQEIAKVAGKPIQDDGAELVLDAVPDKLMVDSLFFLPIKIKNIGQKVWENDTVFKLTVVGATEAEQTIDIVMDKLEPSQEKTIQVALKTPDREGPVPIVLKLEQNGKALFPEKVKKISAIEPPSLWGKTVLFIKRMMKNKEDGDA